MKRLVVTVLAAACACAATTATATRDDLVNLLNEQAAAWSRGDLDAFCSVYDNDAVFISPSGMTKGRQAVLERYRKKYVDKAGMGALTLDIQEVREAGPSSASIVARWALTWPDKPKAEGLTLLVLTKASGRWRIVQDASM